MFCSKLRGAIFSNVVPSRTINISNQVRCREGPQFQSQTNFDLGETLSNCQLTKSLYTYNGTPVQIGKIKTTDTIEHNKLVSLFGIKDTNINDYLLLVVGYPSTTIKNTNINNDINNDNINNDDITLLNITKTLFTLFIASCCFFLFMLLISPIAYFFVNTSFKIFDYLELHYPMR